MPMRRSIPALCFILIFCAAFAGCAGTPVKPSYSVDRNGILSATCPAATATEHQLEKNETLLKSRIVFASQDGNVVAYLATPEKPVAAVVYVPGAGETIAAHGERMLRFARAGSAFLYLDMRGNGGETAGLPFSSQMIQEDYTKFIRGEWPQYYLTVCDISSARQYLTDRYSVPVYAMGSSNGGRYAAVAAGTDPAFAGYIGISTSDWGIYDSLASQGYSGDPLRFAASIEPSTYFRAISPRPVWIYHARADSIIPFESGENFYLLAKEPRTFAEFSGTHGINSDVDNQVLSAWAQIYGTRG